jgi:hypothetical protein
MKDKTMNDVGEPRSVSIGDMLSLDRSRRIEAIGRFRGDPAARDGLKRLSIDVQEDPSVRAAAIVALAEQDHRVEVEAQPPEPVVHALRRAEERIATRKLVQAYLGGEGGPNLPEASLLPPQIDRPISAEVRPLPQDEVLRVLQASGLGPANELRVVGLRCGGTRLALLADRGTLSAERLQSRPARAGKLVVHDADEDRWTTTFDVLTRPAPEPGSFQIAVIDHRGRLRYGGKGWRDRDSVRFTVQAALRAGAAATLVEGKAGPEGIDVLRLESSQTVVPRRKPRRLQA